jgi:hypothetical protein
MEPTSTTMLPYIDPNVEHAGTSKFRKLTTQSLRKMSKAVVIQDNDTPLAVLLKYEQYILIQSKLQCLEKENTDLRAQFDRYKRAAQEQQKKT